MNRKPCRDCGNLLEPGQRGCPVCALNIEAEEMIGRFLWRRLVPGVVGLVLIVAAVVYFLRR
ncbi:MAG: hypothetical protein ABIP75_16565 [Pyrinomonadaceae bacterium]